MHLLYAYASRALCSGHISFQTKVSGAVAPGRPTAIGGVNFFFFLAPTSKDYAPLCTAQVHKHIIKRFQKPRSESARVSPMLRRCCCFVKVV